MIKVNDNIWWVIIIYEDLKRNRKQNFPGEKDEEDPDFYVRGLYFTLHFLITIFANRTLWMRNIGIYQITKYVIGWDTWINNNQIWW